jgi:amidase
VQVTDISGIISESDIDPVFFCECKSCLNAYLSTLRPDVTCTSLEEIIDFNQRHASQTLRYGQPLLLHVQNKTSGAQKEPEYIEALLKREEAIDRFDRVFTESELDVLLCTRCEIIAPITGFPSMSIPMGMDEEGMPIGSYWIARRYGEPTLFRITHAAETRLRIRCEPDLAWP